MGARSLGLISNSRLARCSIVRYPIETFHRQQEHVKVKFMKPPLPISRCVFFRKNSEVLQTKLTTSVANVVLMMELAAFALAKGAVTITTTSLPNAVAGSFYSGTVTAIDGCTPYKWSVVNGSLPPGLSGQPSSSSTSFTISGTPTETGSDSFEVHVEGCAGHTSQMTYTVQVQQPNYAVNLSWDASTSSDITGYNVYRSTTSGGPYSKINTGGLVASTTYADTTVATGTTYYYVTTAVNSSNQESSYSNQTTAEIP
jgi:hypothetical protein